MTAGLIAVGTLAAASFPPSPAPFPPPLQVLSPGQRTSPLAAVRQVYAAAGVPGASLWGQARELRRGWGTVCDCTGWMLRLRVGHSVDGPTDYLSNQPLLPLFPGVFKGYPAHARAARLTRPAPSPQLFIHLFRAGFFKGYLAMNALWLPWNLLYISLYEAAKRRVYYWQLDRMRLDGGGGVQEWTVSAAAPLPACLAVPHEPAAALASRSAPSSSPTLPQHTPLLQTPEGVRVRADPPMLQVLPLWSFPLCSAACSAAASIATHPVDVVKTRLQARP